MNILDILAVVIVGIWFFIGFVKGFVSKIAELVIFLIGTVAAYVYYRNGGGLLGVTLAFAVTTIALHLVTWGIMEMVLKSKMPVPFASRCAGGAIGGVEGAIVVLLMLAFLHLASGSVGAANPFIAKTLDTSFVYARYKAMSMASPIPAVKRVYRIGEMLKAGGGRITLDEQAVSALRENASIKALLTDTQLIESINQRDYGKIISNPSFLSVLNDTKLLKQIVAMVLREDVPAITNEAVAREMAPAPEKTENYLAGIVYLKGSRAAVINNKMHRVGSRIFGGRITEITENMITVEFPDKRKQYSIGDTIP